MRLPPFQPRAPGSSGPLLLLLLTLLVFPGDVRSQDRDAGDRVAYLRALATYFQVPPVELEILLEGRGSVDELPVLLLLSRETGMAPAALSASRRGGATWMTLFRRFGLGAAQLHPALEEGEVDSRVERAWQLYAQTERRDWDRISLTDEEIITLVHLKVFSRHHRVSPGAVLRARAASGSWVEVPRRLGGSG